MLTPLFPANASREAKSMNGHTCFHRARTLPWLLLWLCVTAAPGGLVAAAEPIFPANAKPEKVFEGITLTEGVAVALDGQVYFSDITFSHQSKNDRGEIHAGHIWRFDPTTGKTSIYRSPSGMSNGIKFDARGDMLVCEGADFGGRRVTRTDMKTGMSYIVAAMYEGRPQIGRAHV